MGKNDGSEARNKQMKEKNDKERKQMSVFCCPKNMPIVTL